MSLDFRTIVLALSFIISWAIAPPVFAQIPPASPSNTLWLIQPIPTPVDNSPGCARLHNCNMANAEGRIMPNPDNAIVTPQALNSPGCANTGSCVNADGSLVHPPGSGKPLSRTVVNVPGCALTNSCVKAY